MTTLGTALEVTAPTSHGPLLASRERQCSVDWGYIREGDLPQMEDSLLYSLAILWH